MALATEHEQLQILCRRLLLENQRQRAEPRGPLPRQDAYLEGAVDSLDASAEHQALAQASATKHLGPGGPAATALHELPPDDPPVTSDATESTAETDGGFAIPLTMPRRRELPEFWHDVAAGMDLMPELMASVGETNKVIGRVATLSGLPTASARSTSILGDERDAGLVSWTESDSALSRTPTEIGYDSAIHQQQPMSRLSHQIHVKGDWRQNWPLFFRSDSTGRRVSI